MDIRNTVFNTVPFFHQDRSADVRRWWIFVSKQIKYLYIYENLNIHYRIYREFRFTLRWRKYTIVWWCVLILWDELHYIKTTRVLNYITTEPFWYSGHIYFPIAPVFHSGTHGCSLGKLNRVCVAPWLLCYVRLWVGMNTSTVQYAPAEHLSFPASGWPYLNHLRQLWYVSMHWCQ